MKRLALTAITAAALLASSAGAVSVMPTVVGPGRTVIFDHTGWSCVQVYNRPHRNIVCSHRSHKWAVVMGPAETANVLGGTDRPVLIP